MPSLTSFIRFLGTKPSGDQLAQHLVLEENFTAVSRGALITTFSSEASAHIFGSFGFEESTISFASQMSIWEPSPWTDAIRLGRILTFSSAEAVREEYPHLKDCETSGYPCIVWPLSDGVERTGSLMMQFMSGELAQVIQDMQGAIYLSALYLHLMSSVDADDDNETRVRGNSANSGSKQTQMTERQIEILALMAENLTNAQIGQRLGFSESTIKQETTRIFDLLGVENRRSAVDVATIRQLISPALTNNFRAEGGT